ncbi:MAG: hypothetical protein ABH881_02915 [bacterium]
MIKYVISLFLAVLAIGCNDIQINQYLDSSDAGAIEAWYPHDFGAAGSGDVYQLDAEDIFLDAENEDDEVVVDAGQDAEVNDNDVAQDARQDAEMDDNDIVAQDAGQDAEVITQNDKPNLVILGERHQVANNTIYLYALVKNDSDVDVDMEFSACALAGSDSDPVQVACQFGIPSYLRAHGEVEIPFAFGLDTVGFDQMYTFYIDQNIVSDQDGNYPLDNLIDESNEDDNVLTQRIVVEEATKPDLVITGMLSNTIQDQDIFRLDVEMRNNSNVDILNIFKVCAYSNVPGSGSCVFIEPPMHAQNLAYASFYFGIEDEKINVVVDAEIRCADGACFVKEDSGLIDESDETNNFFVFYNR